MDKRVTKGNDGAGPLAGRKARPVPPAEYRFPDFICIGAQKAGTSWLDSNLRKHPGLWLPPVKELQYFNEIHLRHDRRWTGEHRRKKSAGLLQHYVRKVRPEAWDYRYIARVADIAAGPLSDDWYGRIFALARPDQVCGEVSPDYARLPDAGIRHIAKLSPEGRFVFSLRDPIERSWSHLRMLARNRNFTDVEEFERFARHKDIVDRADYAGAIARWSAVVPAERLQVVFLDDIVGDPHGVLERICGFLGVVFDPALFPDAQTPVHTGDALDMPASVRDILREELRPAYEGIKGLYPEIGAAWMARHY